MSSVVDKNIGAGLRGKGIAPRNDEKSLKGIPLGTPNPDNPKQLLLECNDCGKRRYAEIHYHLQAEVAANGFKKPCPSCGRKRSLRGRREDPIKEFPCGGSVDLNIRHRPEVAEATCGICGFKHDVSVRKWERSWEVFKSYCERCWPWARVALRPEHTAGRSAERDAMYAKILEIRRTLEAKQTPRGTQVPFCVLAKEWDERHPQAKRNTRDTQSYNVRLLSFYFGITPIGDIDLEAGMGLRRYLLTLPPTRGKGCFTKQRSESAVNHTLASLRRIFDYAVERRCVRSNPFPVGGTFTPSRRERQATPLVTVDEENRLLAACTGRLVYLRAIIICLMDTGMQDADRRRLKWRDVDFDGRFITGSGTPMMMTPRLRAAMQTLWEGSDRSRESLIWGDRNLTGFKRDLGVAREVSRVEGLHINHFRPTAAWRMAQAGREFLQIADVLGCKDTKYLKQYLETDPDTAEREKDSPSFKQFLKEQFGVIDDGDGQKSSRAGRPRAFTDEQAFRAIDKLGSRANVSSLARALKCSRPPIIDWVRDQGYLTLPELLSARRSGV